MKFSSYFTILLLLFPLLFILSGCESGNGLESEGPKRLELADPFILLVDTTYYAYGTHGASNGFVVYTSTDLLEWEKSPNYILHKDNVSGNDKFWAPEVYYIESIGKYVMYYSSEEHLYCATANSPLGPFKQERDTPLLEDLNIDPTLLILPDGKAYIYYAKTANGGNTIWCSELGKDYQSIVPGTSRLCIYPSQQWENFPVNEGPEVIECEGNYYMLFSGNGYACPDYGIGVAMAHHPQGPWYKWENNPILQFPMINGITFEGSGHNCLFFDRDKNLKTGFHVHSSPGESNSRFVVLASLILPNRTDQTISVSTDYIIPHVKTNR